MSGLEVKLLLNRKPSGLFSFLQLSHEVQLKQPSAVPDSVQGFLSVLAGRTAQGMPFARPFTAYKMPSAHLLPRESLVSEKKDEICS